MGDSDHPLSNKAATAEFLRQQNLLIELGTSLQNQLNEKESALRTLVSQTDSAIRAMRATGTSWGMTNLSTSASVTDANAYALSAIEKNAGVGGTLAHSTLINKNNITQLQNGLSDLSNKTVIYRGNIDCNTAIQTGIYAIQSYTANRPVEWGGLLVFVASGYVSQLAVDCLRGELHVRARNDYGTWTPWCRLLIAT